MLTTVLSLSGANKVERRYLNSFHKRDKYPTSVFVNDGSQGQDLMKLSSISDYFLIKGVTDGGNDYIHECMFIAFSWGLKGETANTKRVIIFC